MSLSVVNGPLFGNRRERDPSGPEIWPALFPLVCVAVLAVFMTVSGAFGTRDLGVVHRFVLWIVVAGLLVGQCLGLRAVAVRCFPIAAPYLAVLLTVLLMTLELHLLKFTPLLPEAHDPLLPFLGFVAPPVALLGAIILGLRPKTQVPPPCAPAGQAMTEAVSVLRVQAHDHYLEVHTHTGRRFMRSGFQPYVAGFSHGLRVHRSWWIAFEDMVGLERRGRDYRLILRNGQTVPVSRARLEVVRRSLPQKGDSAKNGGANPRF